MNRTPLRLFVLALTAALAALAFPSTAQAAPYCGITWGSLPKTHTGYDPGDDFLDDVRAGQHACFDRLVVDLGGASGFDSFDVRYVSAVTQDGSGSAVSLRGGAKLQIAVSSMPYDSRGHITYAPANRSELVNVSGYRTFRQVAWAGSFEGQTTLALGVRARLPFRVFVLPGAPWSDQGPRLVIDVAHRW